MHLRLGHMSLKDMHVLSKQGFLGKASVNTLDFLPNMYFRQATQVELLKRSITGEGMPRIHAC